MKTKEQNTQNVKGWGLKHPHLKGNRWFLVLFVFLGVVISSLSLTYAYFTATVSRTGEMDFATLSLDITDSTGLTLTSSDLASTFSGNHYPGDTISTSSVYIKNTSNVDVYAILKIKLELFKSGSTSRDAYYERCVTFSGADIESGRTSADAITAGQKLQANFSYQIPGEASNDFQNGSFNFTVKAYAIQKDYLPDDGVHTLGQKAAQFLYEDMAAREITVYQNGNASSMIVTGNTVSSVSVEGITTDNSCGWFYDEECIHAANPTDVMTTSTQLFTKTATTNKLSGTTNVSAANTSISGEVVIPKTINGVQVTTVSGFTDCDNITSVTIPTGVTTISNNAFKGCDLLETINIPNSVTTIGSGAFMNSALEGIDFDDDAALAAISMEMFRNSSLTSITIPRGVTEIGSYAFAGCGSLTAINFESGHNLDRIGLGAFWGCSSLTSLHIPAGTKFVNGNLMFSGCSSLTSLDLSQCGVALGGSFNSMQSMFNDCTNLETLDVSGLDTSAVTVMYGTFSGCRSLKSLDLSTFDTSKVTTMLQMFYNCRALESLDISSFRTPKVTRMDRMFQYCYALDNIDLSGFDTTKVTTMQCMFNNCRAMTSLNLSSFVTTLVTNMDNMFSECYVITSIDMSNFVTTSVTTMRMMFYCCYALASLDLSSFNTSTVTNMNSMFHTCNAITTIYASTNFVTSGVTDSAYMFNKAKLLVGGNGTAWDASYIDKTYARIDAPGTPGYFTLKSAS